MGISQRARAVQRRWALEREAARAAARAAAAAEAEAFRHEHLDRHRAADLLGMSPHKLKRLTAARQGPLIVRTGRSQQSRTIYLRTDCVAWAADPAAYDRHRAARALELAEYGHCPEAEPPGGSGDEPEAGLAGLGGELRLDGLHGCRQA